MSNYDPGQSAPYQTTYPPPPPVAEKPKRGCFRWFGIASLAFVGLIVVIAIAAASGGGGGDDQDKPATNAPDEPRTNSGNEENPPTEDITLTDCGPGVGNPAGGNFLGAAGTITNHSSKPSSYLFTVEFVTPDGTRYAESPGAASAVAAGQTVEWDAPTVDEARPDTECRITQVDRFAS
jgi:hypothetical protein